MRRKTREVVVGNVGIGGKNPVRVQSMTTTKTADVDATVAQIQQLADAGCEIVRVTVQGKKEADACEHIKNRLIQLGISTPIVADIHFYPPAALRVADFVEGIRINPGNYADRRATFSESGLTEEEFEKGLEKIEEKFAPLVLKCKTLGRAMRIGTNHGSLSDRIMTKYGDSPEGMVASALEYAEICRKYDYHNFVFSMKSSNTLVMSEAYRLLVDAMDRLGWDYPLHLGVTEAGAGVSGRVKSAAGIGGLLLDGIGDTIRVSLSEEPVAEIPACQTILHGGIENGAYTLWTLDNPNVHPQGSVFVSGLCEDADTSFDPSMLKKATLHDAVLIVECHGNATLAARHVVKSCSEAGVSPVLILKKYFSGSEEEVALKAGAEMGGALIDKIAHGVCIEADLSAAQKTAMGFSLLQGCRMRSTKTEFIACPSCGRTLFNLMDVTKRIEQKTSHLPGVKIAIMGCIVNGPGEMADADFGYVGSKTGMVDLYVGKTCVERGIPEKDADNALIHLIKEHGRWVDPC